ncbi:hypothetical protein Bbelb_230710 [Branchiostoma belcheri]|nr:hypothetical protein Bbelb_230710 [Branchiostoma belcheri]
MALGNCCGKEQTRGFGTGPRRKPDRAAEFFSAFPQLARSHGARSSYSNQLSNLIANKHGTGVRDWPAVTRPQRQIQRTVPVASPLTQIVDDMQGQISLQEIVSAQEIGKSVRLSVITASEENISNPATPKYPVLFVYPCVYPRILRVKPTLPRTKWPVPPDKGRDANATPESRTALRRDIRDRVLLFPTTFPNLRPRQITTYNYQQHPKSV